MQREAKHLTIAELRQLFPEVEFPEYQREPSVWSRSQKQRLIDSIVRQFDISSFYFYERDDGGVECIDGRQRLNAIMSFIGDNPSDHDNGYPVRMLNEVTAIEPSGLPDVDGRTFAELEGGATDDLRAARDSFLDYRVTAVFLSGSHAPEEFNLQFLRLNLGALINAGEKLHAMVGSMRDLLFESDRLGRHPFFERVRVPTRRFAKEQVAAQVALQVFAFASDGQFTRARHFDLQKFLKENADLPENDPRIEEIGATLDVLESQAGHVAGLLRNRAITVSVVLAAWDLRVSPEGQLADDFGAFLSVFLNQLQDQVQRMKRFDPDQRYPYLVDFQRHLTQAAVERPAVTFRHDVLKREFANWKATGELSKSES